MKRICILLLFLLLNQYVGIAQDIPANSSSETNETIHQISTNGFDNILSFQSLNLGISNFVLTQQIGRQNKILINQQGDLGSATTNQLYNFQQGSSNELSVGQIGSGNLLLSFQLGYQANVFGQIQGYQSDLGFGSANGNTFSAYNGTQVEGERNKLTVNQEGTNNGVMSIQQGNDNSILAEQKGTNNFLFILQKGKNNSVTGYKQGNTSGNILFDTIIQEGESLSLITDNVSMSKPNRNIFSQSGTNLSLQVNNEFVNSLGGIEITQNGRDMKVVIDQSYFSFPDK